MKTWKLTPQKESIERLVECYWYLEKEANDTSESYPKLYPDPSSHLIITNSKQKYNYNGQVQETGGCHWIYPYQNTYTIDHSEPFRILGIKFKIGALYSLPIISNKDQLNSVIAVDINKIIQLEELSLIGLLDKAAKEPESTRDFLNSKLQFMIHNSRDDKHSRLVSRVLNILPQTSIRKVGEQLHLSQRTVERSFTRVTHLTMKQCQSMLRLEQVLDFIYKQKIENIIWSDLASQFEFSDQPHFIRSLKNAIGKTPNEYSKHQDLAIDVYGNFEIE